jgi:3-oxoacyl-[acyl-carrier-protein] synthase-3
MSKITDMTDRSTALLFGDAATVTALEVDENAGGSYFTLGTDGSGAANLIIPGSDKGIKDSIINDKKIKNPSKLFMDGWNVFNFTISMIPQIINDSLENSKLNLNEIDYFLLHQANAFMINHLIKKSKIKKEKTLTNIEKYGNTSCASIPLLMTTELVNLVKLKKNKVMLVGFGVGYSWGTVVIDIQQEIKLGIIEI